MDKPRKEPYHLINNAKITDRSIFEIISANLLEHQKQNPDCVKCQKLFALQAQISKLI